MINVHLFFGSSFVDIVRNDFDFLDIQNQFIILEDHSKTSVEKTLLEIQKVQKEKGILNLIIHNLDGSKAQIINRIKKEFKIHWCTWGYDIYNAHFGFRTEDFLSKETLNAVDKKELSPNVMYKIKNKIFRKSVLGFYSMVKGEKHFYSEIESALKKIDTVSCVLPDEFPYIKKKLNHISFRPYSYGKIESIIPNQLIGFKSEELGNKIMIGNSASPTNNHLDVIKYLKNEFELIIPVSYGSQIYKESLIKDYSHEKIEFLADYMPYDDYLSKMTEANTFIMNVFRQQGMGNLNVALYLGMRVYLNPKNFAFQFYKNLGIHVYSFPDDFQTFGNKSLSDQEVKDNREGLERYYGNVASNERLKAFEK